ncbi:MAG: DUF4258 domain-containing protein [Clostridia bacterium]|nr:DUF4258 domain-containing protein [Clostridia bacterium]
MDKLPYTINDLRKAIQQKRIFWTEHSDEKMLEREIRKQEVRECIINGEVIEEYDDDTPFPSCLVFGKTINGRNLHACCSYCNGAIYIITAYEPNLLKWNDDFKTRRSSD